LELRELNLNIFVSQRPRIFTIADLKARILQPFEELLRPFIGYSLDIVVTDITGVARQLV
jgi:hypothetical protein